MLEVIRNAQAVKNISAQGRLTFVDTTNVGAATIYYATTSGQRIEGHRNLSLTGTISATTGGADNILSVEVTNDEDLATGTWVPIYGYNAYTNATVNNITVNGATSLFALCYDVFNFYAYRVKLVVGDAANTIQIQANLSS